MNAPYCYAKELGGCSTKITDEHYVSESVLRLIGEANFIFVNGLGGNEATQRYDYSSLAHKQLCHNHNSALNHLDGEAVRLFKAIVDIRKRRGTGGQTYKIDGKKIERWIMKVYAGHPDTPKYPPIEWLKIIYGKSELPQTCGLYLETTNGELVRDPVDFGYMGLFARHVANDELHLVGSVVWIQSVFFRMDFTKHQNSPKGLYRPSEIQFTTGDKLEFAW